MTEEAFKKAQKCNSRIRTLECFKSDLLAYMEEDSTRVSMGDHFEHGTRLWDRLLKRFSNSFKLAVDAPSIDVSISDEDGKQLYFDLCAVADKHIAMYKKRMEEL